MWERFKLVESKYFWECQTRITEKEKITDSTKREVVISGNNSRVRELKTEINILLDRKAWMWSQHSHVLKLAHGDNNSRYFHMKATQRYQKKKLIGGIKDTTETWQTQPKDITAIFLQYYQAFFSSSNPTDQSTTLDQVPRVITKEMEQLLTSDFLEHEVTMALKQMAPLKALVQMGYLRCFISIFGRW